MKINYIGIIGSILAFVSIMFPWWRVNSSSSFLGDISAQYYLFMRRDTYFGGFSEYMTPTVHAPEIWQIAPLALLITGGIIGLIGGLKKKTKILFSGGLCVSLSLAMFAGLVIMINGFLFLSKYESGLTTSAFLDIGFWLALISSIILFSSLAVNAMSKPAVPQIPQAAYQQSQTTFQQPQSSQKQIPSGVCPKCYSWVYEDTKFCPRCGLPLLKTEKPPTEQTQRTRATYSCERIKNKPGKRA